VTRLTSADLRGALAAAGTWHRAASLAELQTTAVTTLHDLIRCDGVGWNEVDVRTGEVRAVTSPPEYLRPELVAELERTIDQHPTVRYVERTGDTSARKISDFVSVRELHALEIYTDFFRPLAVEDLLAVLVRADPVIVGIACTRGRRTWAERDRELLNVLKPHLASAYAAVVARAEAQARIAALERGLEGRTVVRLSASGRLEERSEVVERWFGSTTDAPAAGTYERDDASLAVRRVEGDPPLLLVDERRLVADPRRARELGLTPRESEIVMLAGRGESDEAIARRLFLSTRTVAKHLEHAYEKLGVHSRAAAAARLLD
jgi:DNA-binding CsgD family transcriptional regulator